MLRKVGNLYRQADIFAEPIPLNVGGNEFFKTKTGATISFIYIIAAAVITYQEFYAYFDRTEPQTTIEGYSTENYPKINLFKEKLVPFFIGSAIDTDYVPVENLDYYVTLRSHRLSWVTSKLPDDSIIVQKLTKPIPVVPCKTLEGEDLDVFSYIDKDSSFYDIFLDYGMCPKLGDSITIEGKGIDDFMEEFIFNIKPCSLRTGCATKNEVEAFSFILAIPTATFNASNFESPHSQSPQADYLYYLASKAKQVLSFSFVENQVYNYVGFNPEWEKVYTYYDLGQPVLNVMNRNENTITCLREQAMGPEGSGCSSYFSLSLMSSGSVIMRKREYQTLMDTLGTIGGVTGIISAAFLFLYGFINERKRASFIMKSVYPMHVAEELNAKNEEKLNSRRRPFPLCCLKKRDNLAKSTDQPLPKDSLTRKQIYERIEQSLDVLNIVRDSCYMRIFAELLMKQRHKGLSQLVDVKLWKEEEDRKEGMEVASDGKDTNRITDDALEGMLPIFKVVSNQEKDSKMLKYKIAYSNRVKWIKEIRDCHLKKDETKSNKDNTDDGKTPLEKAMDDFYYQELVQSSFYQSPDHVNMKPSQLSLAGSGSYLEKLISNLAPSPELKESNSPPQPGALPINLDGILFAQENTSHTSNKHKQNPSIAEESTPNPPPTRPSLTNSQPNRPKLVIKSRKEFSNANGHTSDNSSMQIRKPDSEQDN